MIFMGTLLHVGIQFNQMRENNVFAEDPVDIYYTEQIEPIFDSKGCFGCHGGDIPRAGGVWDRLANQIEWRDKAPLIDKENPFNSTLLTFLKL